MTIKLLIADDHPIVRDGVSAEGLSPRRALPRGPRHRPRRGRALPRGGQPDHGPDARAGQEPLSRREIEVLALIARGSTNKEAAKKLFISEATVKTHLIHAYAKLGVNDRAAAVAVAYSRGLLGG
jgi:DNA-binding NarL/FixJ family response regulator